MRWQCWPAAAASSPQPDGGISGRTLGLEVLVPHSYLCKSSRSPCTPCPKGFFVLLNFIGRVLILPLLSSNGESSSRPRFKGVKVKVGRYKIPVLGAKLRKI